MDCLRQLRIVGALICSSMAFNALADANSTNTATDSQQTTIQTSLNTNQTATDSPKAQINDTEILAAVDAALAPYKDKVKVQVTNGIVTLSGN
ncbi:hypothetical protein EP47_14480 [Legionella norrlandica]|uniref:BON domain-containing protein n=1 Tax=Legionella norrlandica TaxID=1498499 RepID=A0A0A2SSS4_9GAMM|nr:hypothetical protein [Legionella norrlandica]KGP62469.1 hypothetical protein EP47_14480 [Legionella norrlandica]